MSEMVGTKKAADILGVSVSTVYRMIEQGLLQPTKTPGGQRRFDITQLETFKETSKAIVAPQNPYQMKMSISTGDIVEDIDAAKGKATDEQIEADHSDDTDETVTVDNKPLIQKHS